MDLSQEYILMCGKAKEIQNIRQADDCVSRNEWWKSGDFIFDKEDESIFNVCDIRHCAASTGYFDDESSVWLPRQDQLQEMIKGDKDWYHLLCYFGEWFEYYGCGNIHSIEQAWLEYLMQVKFNKTWNGQDWIDAR